MGVDGVMRICPDPDEYKDILQLVHVSFAGYHYSGLETTRRARFEGYWWHKPLLRCQQFCDEMPNLQLEVSATI